MKDEKFNNPFAKLKKVAPPAEEKPAAKPLPEKLAAPTSHDEDVALFLSRVGGAQRLGKDPRGQIIAPAKPDKNVTMNEMHDLVSQIDRGSRWVLDEILGAWHGPGVPFALLRDLAAGKIEPEARLDLHGLRVAIAEPTVEKFVRSAHQERRRCVLIITGRGELSGGVLHDSLGDWLKGAHSTKRVLAFVAAPRSLGGDGATLVLLRRA